MPLVLNVFDLLARDAYDVHVSQVMHPIGAVKHACATLGEVRTVVLEIEHDGVLAVAQLANFGSRCFGYEDALEAFIGLVAFAESSSD
jgi:hypothetical protein